MTRDEWLGQFEDELKKLRPHVGDRLAHTLALQKFDLKQHPRDLARAYDRGLRDAQATVAPKKKAR
ncbi:MAG TPA: hypothetical protein VML58_15045 [Burkholderiaceae bacterium]|nr:hypothetical protein [Burkholderiaceae bacterium]